MSSWSDMASGSDRLSFLTSREGIGFSPSHPLQAACDHQGLFQGLFHAKGDSGGSALDGSPDKLGVIRDAKAATWGKNRVRRLGSNLALASPTYMEGTALSARDLGKGSGSKTVHLMCEEGDRVAAYPKK